jgi:succinoglycan biosynthesis transport protein ExoP
MARSSKLTITFQDVIHYATRYVKYGKIGLLLFLLGIIATLVFFTYGQPVYYSRSQVAFTNLTLPITSETSDNTGGKGRYAQVTFMVVSGLNSRWIVEQTALKLNLTTTAGQYEDIRDKYISKISVTMLPGNLLQFEVWAYEPWLVKVWPEAMIKAYRESTVEARSRHREMASATYAEEMEKLRDKINSEQDARSKFEEDNHLIEQYISNNSLEGVPSEMLTIKTRLDTMQQVEGLINDKKTPSLEILSLLKKFRGTPVPIGTIMRRGVAETFIAKGPSTAPTSIAAFTSEAPQMPAVPSVQTPDGGVRPMAGSVVVVPSMVEGVEPWEETERELRAVQFERQNASKSFLPGHETIRKLDKKIEQLTASMENERATAMNSFILEREQLRNKLEELQKKMPDYRRILNDFDRYKKEYSLMVGGDAMWEVAYSNLQKRLSSMEYTGIDMKVEFDFKGFTMLRDDIPVSPDKSKLFTYAILLGIGCAGGACFGLEHLRATTSMVAETEKITGLYALGVVPKCLNSDSLNAFSNKNIDGSLNLGETFRIVRSSLPLFVSNDNKCQVIMVTSSRPGDGKTTISSLLGRSYADSGQRTLLIDGDLRRGRVHKLLEGEQTAGLAGFLSKDIADIHEVIVSTPTPNLDALTKGKQATAKYEALSSTSFYQMIQDLRKDYDRIIIDTPPLLGLADSIMISGSVDGILLVIRADQTTHRDVRTALEIIEGTRRSVFGFVLNAVDLDKLENYYYYTSYYPKYYDPSYVAEEAA